MKWFLAGVLLCWARVASGSELPDLVKAEPPSDPEVQCLAGTEWESHCHLCQCLPNGVATCLKQESCDISIKADPIPCKPNSVFYRGCDSCMCLSNGEALCSATPCRQSNVPKKSELLSGKECSPGSEWTSQCNECHCTAEGYSSCTELKCPGLENERVLRCAPDTVWMNECNTCWCNSEGRAMCTRMGCSIIPSLDFHIRDSDNNEEIKPESVLKSPLKQPNKTKEVICFANRMFIKDCNTCWCNEDGTSYFCTRKVCVLEPAEEVGIEDVQEEKARVFTSVCRPDEVFEIDCNMCRCNADGQSFSCTRRACYLEDDAEATTVSRKRRASPQEPPKACQPGQEFRMDCNKCLCDNEGQDFSCTRIDCNALNNNNNGGSRSKRETTEEISTKCDPGSVFQQSCNVCRCGTDGLAATCTTHDCDAIKTYDGFNAPDFDPNFRCNPGEQFKRDCNDCTCSADGKSVFCTLLLCSMYNP